MMFHYTYFYLKINIQKIQKKNGPYKKVNPYEQLDVGENNVYK